MPFTDQEKLQVKRLLQDPSWQVIENFAEEFCKNKQNDISVQPTEWETMSSLLTAQGKIQGVRMFIQELYKAAQNT